MTVTAPRSINTVGDQRVRRRRYIDARFADGAAEKAVGWRSGRIRKVHYSFGLPATGGASLELAALLRRASRRRSCSHVRRELGLLWLGYPPLAFSCFLFGPVQSRDQAERALWRGQPVGFSGRAWCLVLDVERDAAV